MIKHATWLVAAHQRQQTRNLGTEVRAEYRQFHIDVLPYCRVTLTAYNPTKVWLNDIT